MSKNRLLGLLIILGLTPIALCGLSGTAVYAQKRVIGEAPRKEYA